MSKVTLFGKLLNKVRYERQLAREKAIRELWSRNGLDNPVKRDGYRIETSVVVGRDGNEATKFELWKKLDESVIIVSSQVTTEVVETEPGDDIGKLLNG